MSVDADRGSRSRRLLAGAGVALVIVAYVLPDSTSVLPIEALVTAVGNDYRLVALLSVVTLGIAVIAAGRGRGFEETETAAVEGTAPVPPAGKAFDEAVRRPALLIPYASGTTRTVVRERLRTAAIETMARTGTYEREEATARVAAGDWTDDPQVAAFLADGITPSADVAGWLHALAHGRSPFGYRARRTARIIAEYDGQGRVDDD